MTSCGLLHLAEREHKLLVTALDSDALNAHKVLESGLSRPSAVACAKRWAHWTHAAFGRTNTDA